jgi:hypothetical protein
MTYFNDIVKDKPRFEITKDYIVPVFQLINNIILNTLGSMCLFSKPQDVFVQHKNLHRKQINTFFIFVQYIDKTFALVTLSSKLEYFQFFKENRRKET